MADGPKVDMSLLWKEFPQFKEAQFRVDEESREGSVLDSAALVLGSAGAARKAYHDLKRRVESVTGRNTPDQTLVDLLDKVTERRIDGKGQPTPTAPFAVLLEIIFILPGKRAHEFRRTCAKYIARLLSGDLTLIPEIEARFDSSTPEEREFFRNGTDDTPDRKRQREELEHERRLRLKREEVEIQRMELENGRMELENSRMRVENRAKEIESVKLYQELLENFGLDRDPRMRMLVNDAVSNLLVPTRLAIEGGDAEQYMTVGKFMVEHGVKKSASVVGRQMSKKYQEQFGKEPEVTQMMVNGDFRAVKVYPVEFLKQHIL